MVTPKQLYHTLTKRMAECGNADAAFDAGCILSQLTGIPIHSLLLKPEISDAAAAQAAALTERRCSGEPLQYLLGEWEFYGMRMLVGKGVLIPRPDTETLTETAAEWGKNRSPLVIADLCTGSGCIALSLAKLLPHADVWAVEKSPEAYAYAEQNIRLHRLPVHLCRGDVLEAETLQLLPGLDLIVSNPPYLNAQDMANLQTEVQHEPAMALDGGEDGFLFYREITRIWKNALHPGGMLAYEAGIGQAKEITLILQANGFENIRIVQDLCGVDRVVCGIKS